MHGNIERDSVFFHSDSIRRDSQDTEWADEATFFDQLAVHLRLGRRSNNDLLRRDLRRGLLQVLQPEFLLSFVIGLS